MTSVRLLAIVVVLAASVQGAPIFFDDFESYSAPSGGFSTVSSPSSFGLWGVTAGSVDILNNFPGLPCYSGSRCLDLDGSTGAAGTINRNVNFIAGVTYNLSFFYSGNRRSGSDSLTVTLGTQTLNLTSIPSSTPWTQTSLSFTPVANTTGPVRFAHSGGDNIGILLDNVELSDDLTSEVPEPSSFLLMGAGLTIAGLLRKRRRS